MKKSGKKQRSCTHIYTLYLWVCMCACVGVSEFIRVFLCLRICKIYFWITFWDEML